MTFQPVSPSRIETPGWFLDNEEWVVQYRTCGKYTSNWVEVGVTADTFAAERYFWADDRPVDCLFFKHYITNIPSGDYGFYTYFSISRISSTSWNISVSSQTGSWGGTSTNNTMSPDNAQQGMELAGQNGSSAPATQYTNRTYKDTSNRIVSIGSGYSITSYNPPNLHVNNSPSFGDFYTTCCTPGGSPVIAPPLIGGASHPYQGAPMQPVGSNVLNAGSTGVTRAQVIQYAKTVGIAFATALKPITVDSAQLLTSAQIAQELHGEQTGFPPDHVFWFVRVSGQFSAELHQQRGVYGHGVIVIDPATGNLVLDGGLQN